MHKLKLGKAPATQDHRDLKMVKYLNLTKLPTPPKTFGHETPIKDWLMLGNDNYGDCVFAGAAHETMLWNKAQGHDIPFNDKVVLDAYAAVTGFDPVTGNNDNGTNVRDALNYRRKIGMHDAFANTHKIGAYLSLTPGNLNHIYIALYLFGAVGIGIEFPDSAMDQFNKGKPWSVIKDAKIEGGHYIPLVGKRSHLEVITWGKLQGMTTGFYTKYCDEAYAILSPEFLSGGKTPEGFDLATLQADLKLL